MRTAEYWIEELRLLPHPEGGYYREAYRSAETVGAEALPARFGGARTFSTAIYFLLNRSQVSVFHRLRADEVWHFYEGAPLLLHVINEDCGLETVTLGRGGGERLQWCVKAGLWFAAEVSDKQSYTLAGCTVAPGFEYCDLEYAERRALSAAVPRHLALIERLTRD